MMTNAISPLSYPLLAAIFARPSLLEAKVTPEALSAVLPANDSGELKQLSGRKAEKLTAAGEADKAL